MKPSDLIYGSLVIAVMAAPVVYAASMSNIESYNMTRKECTKLPSMKTTYTDEEFKKRTEWCNRMNGDLAGTAPAGKDSTAITARN